MNVRVLTIRFSAMIAVVGALLLYLAALGQVPAQTVADDHPESTADPLVMLKAENERLRGLIPSQSHAMLDVSMHFTNLWFAAQHRNWPLAQFYLGETRNHIKWAIRLVPVRKSKAGPVKLQERFEPFDAEKLAAIEKAIATQDRKQFNNAYRDAITGCNDCHKASDKPYLRVIVPDKPEAHDIDFNPE